MEKIATIKRALISVYDKDLILEIANELVRLGVEILSTGGTQDYLTRYNIPVKSVESITGFPSVFGGRVKTLQPQIMGGILRRRDNPSDIEEGIRHNIPDIDLVIVDLYPFEQTVASGASEEDIIEKIDIGGISLIRAAAKNYNDVVIIPGKECYSEILTILKEQDGKTTLAQRRHFAAKAFLRSSYYDTCIFKYFNATEEIPAFDEAITEHKSLRYGENPHQKAFYFGNGNSLPEQLHGKELSYNNLLDVEAAVELINDFDDTAVAIIKHNNACGCAVAPTLLQAWERALEADPVSAFGGIIATNRTVDAQTAEQINKLFFEVIIAPDYCEEALAILKSKKNRIILKNENIRPSSVKFRTLLGGVLVQDRDSMKENEDNLQEVSERKLTQEQKRDLLFANILVKHSKSNAIVLAKDNRLLASGVGQTSRVDALRHAIEKAGSFNLSLEGAVMASDAFFPFPDCVEIADKAGIEAVVHPGGSIRDAESVAYCNEHNMAMAITGFRHFKH